jgi:hypothetical protein
MKWQDPPDKGPRSSKWSRIFAELKENPNRWAAVYDGKSHNANSTAGRLRPRWPGYEITVRKTGEETAGVWARYVPEHHTKTTSNYAEDSVPDALDALEDYGRVSDQHEDAGGSELG